MSLRELYQEMILDHSKHPRQFGAIEKPEREQRGHNPLCGDEIQIYLNLTPDKNAIQDVQFTGHGCAICMASCSMMCENLKNKSLCQVDRLFELFHQLLLTGDNSHEEELEKLAIFSGVFAFPVRVKCATLSWHTLMAALRQSTDCVSTED